MKKTKGISAVASLKTLCRLPGEQLPGVTGVQLGSAGVNWGGCYGQSTAELAPGASLGLLFEGNGFRHPSALRANIPVRLIGECDDVEGLEYQSRGVRRSRIRAGHSDGDRDRGAEDVDAGRGCQIITGRCRRELITLLIWYARQFGGPG